ncbi:MAG: acyl-CoA thioesterase [Clostridia bacterium]|nr:acyl-CoA thioesterase [Clostridia bacterium]
MNINETKIKVRYAETDQMGVVHHSRYYPWFEVGRTELFASGGKTYGDMEKEGVMMPLVETRCRYIIPARYEDELIIKTKVASLSGVKIEFEYDVIRQNDGTLLAKGYTLMAFTDLKFKPVNLKKQNPAFWDYIVDLKEKTQE